MILKIPDDLSGGERQRILEIFPVVYALWKMKGCLQKTADFLGISKTALTKRIMSCDELKVFCRNPKELPDLLLEQDWTEQASHPMFKIYRHHLRKLQTTFWYNSLSEQDKEKAIARIRSLYYD